MKRVTTVKRFVLYIQNACGYNIRNPIESQRTIQAWTSSDISFHQQSDWSRWCAMKIHQKSTQKVKFMAKLIINLSVSVMISDDNLKWWVVRSYFWFGNFLRTWSRVETTGMCGLSLWSSLDKSIPLSSIIMRDKVHFFSIMMMMMLMTTRILSAASLSTSSILFGTYFIAFRPHFKRIWKCNLKAYFLLKYTDF